MPAQQASAGDFLKEMGNELAKSWSNHANDQTEITGNFSDPPPFEDGVAKLKKVTLAKYKPDVKSEDLRGKWYFMAEAIIVTPKKAKDPDTNELRPVAGKATKIGPIPLCNTPSRAKDKTFDDHIRNIMNEIRKLGIPTQGSSHDKLPAFVAALNKRANDPKNPLYIKCRAWKGAKATEGPYAGKEPMLQHVWMGLALDFNPNVDLAAGVDDETAATGVGTMPSRNGAGKPPQGKPPVATATAAPEEEPAEPFNEFADGTVGDAAADEDLDALAEVANGQLADDVVTATAEQLAAGTRVKQVAEQWGVTTDECDAADDFTAIVALIREKQEAQGGQEAAAGEAGGDDVAAEPDDADADADAEPEPEPEPEPAKPAPAKPAAFVPKVGDTGKVKVKGTDGKVKTVPVNCTKVNRKEKTAELENLDDKRKKWTGDKAMAWDKVKWD